MRWRACGGVAEEGNPSQTNSISVGAAIRKGNLRTSLCGDVRVGTPFFGLGVHMQQSCRYERLQQHAAAVQQSYIYVCRKNVTEKRTRHVSVRILRGECVDWPPLLAQRLIFVHPSPLRYFLVFLA